MRRLQQQVFQERGPQVGSGDPYSPYADHVQDGDTVAPTAEALTENGTEGAGGEEETGNE